MASESPPRLRVLVVDDETKLTELLKLELNVEGYDVDVASDGASGLIRSRTEPSPDLVILDWNLPDFSGIDICQRIRASGVTTPILMLTGHDEITDRVKALDAGVDDYLIKPFSIDELMARLRAMHRRAESFSGGGSNEQLPQQLQVADLVMDTRTRDVSRGGRTIQLSVKEYELLNFLMRGAGRVLERAEIMRGVWGENFFGDDNLLDVYIRYLRQKVESKDAVTLIHTIRGVGFILREGEST
ncbi:MAG: DNA-binding response regulator [Cyanobium sp. NAT70]|nr:DNA-binding response regulator [Cyanobium sp. NAT70]